VSPAVHESAAMYIEENIQIRIGTICW
jgi:hypothetical protein